VHHVGNYCMVIPTTLHYTTLHYTTLLILDLLRRVVFLMCSELEIMCIKEGWLQWR